MAESVGFADSRLLTLPDILAVVAVISISLESVYFYTIYLSLTSKSSGLVIDENYLKLVNIRDFLTGSSAQRSVVQLRHRHR